ncbi:carbamoyl phosphate synthase small subunit [Candidatus Roizmanbacteria bacterium RIFCSPLOWO2_01_FULL_38_12]|uniref:Carbamoyl phosphate synthase small chain n=1 Tax=Candidatus Roizmanbacteria bacterium RIFCSPLOWO2_01_FULL_38_12 TaxID=1802061 RepID=A0A1F7IYU3_9BACT|nr:MAG: carbamoyl phosphate synthase small subunit [Candidatus Roizmanbacteria bacterium RIFCSPHIGHO2_01_FULL_38_15]OGK34407.1 MAG: carbamoyl phosphate synthase small subunit [Candidatus Roizmanbacteria bacterium RIFCSPHIGHO2_12_FULL_38_13]OGK48540.1 MAG: carbamoyl phosphate synthase small subunit [Candidatus Roizmanbacteria bacterium RIFCSPLOWO2_01_FULL_38_12]
MKSKQARLVMQDGSSFVGMNFGHHSSVAGEVVFTTGMVGYPESMTDPSYRGQILIFTYPLIGNYGVPENQSWESRQINVAGIVVSTYIDDNSHPSSTRTLGEWLKSEKKPGIEIKDTRLLTQKLREKGAMLGKIIIDKDIPWYDPNVINIVDEVSTKSVYTVTPENTKKTKKIVLIDCGQKRNIVRSLVRHGATVTVVPWDFDLTKYNKTYDGVVVSNGPGDPKIVKSTIATVAALLKKNTPVLGICLGHQILALAAGGDTYKLKYGHRSQNQPCKIHDGSEKYFLTTQNHGFAVGKIPKGFQEWFSNGNDGTNEGIIHARWPFMSVQFHPEAFPGPNDTRWIFDYFLKKTGLLRHPEFISGSDPETSSG